MLERDDDRWTVTDLGSMNGTYLGDSTVALEAHTPVPVSPGTPIFVGGWTRLDLDLPDSSDSSDPTPTVD